MANRDSRQQQAGQIIAGIVLVTLGILFLGQQIDLWEAWSFRRLWPVIVIAVGLRHLLSPRHARERVSGLVLTSIGGVWLLDTTGMFGLRGSWPLFIVIAGVVIMVNGVCGPSTLGCGGGRHHGQ
jgi:hypothetical protein